MGYYDFITGKKQPERRKEKPEKKDKGEDVLKEFSKDRLSKEKMFFQYFKIYFGKPKGISNKNYNSWVAEQQQNIVNFVQTQMMVTDSTKKSSGIIIYKGTLHKNSSVQYLNEKGIDYFLIRFPDMREKDGNTTGVIVSRHSKEEAYLFNPIQSIDARNILSSIEKAITLSIGIKPVQGTTNFTFEGKKLIVTENDGIQFFSYSLEKRVKLYQKYPQIDKLLFGKKDFMWFVNWIMEKRADNVHMKKYCEAVEELLKEYKVEFD